MMRVLISKSADGNWHFETAFFDEERSLALEDLHTRQQQQPDTAFELQLMPDHAFEALTAALRVS